MNWQARLRRFQWPGGTGTQSETTNAQLDWGFDPWPGGLSDACTAVAGGDVCSRGVNLVEAIGDLIVH